MIDINTLIPALLGLLGTILVAIIGYYQWKRQHKTQRTGTAFSDKQAAYKAIWNRLENAHLYVRSERFELDRYLELVREVNIELMQSGLLLARGDKMLVNEYLQALRSLAESIDDQKDDSLRQEVRDTLYSTQPLPPEVLQRADGLRQAYENVEKRRESLIQSFRRAIGADIE